MGGVAEVPGLGARLRGVLGAYPELAVVVVGAALGLWARPPFAWLGGHQGISVLLAVLVFATALGIDPTAVARLGASWRRLLLALAAGAVLLPILAWLAARLVSPGPLRLGVVAVGVAPCEIASVATTAMAGGSAALAAGVLAGSTIACIALAGPILGLAAGSVHLHPAGIVVNLLLVVALPLAAGLGARVRLGVPPPIEDGAGKVAIGAVGALVALVAAEVHLSTRYLGVAGALVVFLAGSVLIGRLLGIGSGRQIGRSILLTTSMRDFAIAAEIATAAFGRASSAPLGLYGIFVLLWGTAAAGFIRRRDELPSPKGP
jgi:predicted Na+-dependent transporter